MVYEALCAVRRQVSVGNEGNRLSRVSARILNTFEPGRTQTKPFFPVQEETTLRRYASYWSRLLFFLIRLQSETYRDQLSDQHHRIDLQTEHWVGDIVEMIGRLHEAACSQEHREIASLQEQTEVIRPYKKIK
jgi:hypothetical protein